MLSKTRKPDLKREVLESIDECISFYFEYGLHGRSKSTVDTYRQRLNGLVDFFGGERNIHTLDEDHFDMWVSHLFEEREMFVNNDYRNPIVATYKPRTIQNHIRVIQIFFRWLRKKRIIEHNPTDLLEMPKVPPELPKAISKSDLGLLLRYLKERSVRNYAIVHLLAATGMRAQGLTTLRLENIDLSDRCALVTEKGNKQRLVVFSEACAEAVRAYIHIRNAPYCNYLFVSDRPGESMPLTVSGLRRMLNRASEQAGLSRIYSPHAFRHFFGTESARRGGTDKWLKNMMGHADGRTTDLYIRFNVAGLREQYDRIYAGADFEGFR